MTHRTHNDRDINGGDCVCRHNDLMPDRPVGWVTEIIDDEHVTVTWSATSKRGRTRERIASLDNVGDSDIGSFTQ